MVRSPWTGVSDDGREADGGARSPTLEDTTGYPDPVVEERMRAAGVFDYIIKDMDMRFLDRLPIAALAAVE